MAIGDYVKKTWVNNTTPALNATNLQYIDNKISELDANLKIVLKTADENLTNTTFQNDDKLAIALEAGKKYYIECFLKVFADSQGCDIKTKWTYSGSLAYSYRYGLGMDYAGTYPIGDNAMLISCDIGDTMVSGVDNTFITYLKETLLLSVSTNGTLQLQTAQYVDANTTIVKAGSFLKCTAMAVT